MADARQQGGIPYVPRESSGCGFYNAKPYMTHEAYEAHVRRCQELAANAAQEQIPNEVKIGARDIAGAYAARQDGPHGAMLGIGPPEVSFTYGGTAKMLRAPGKTFSRETICAIIRGQIAITHDSHLKDLLTIFENLE